MNSVYDQMKIKLLRPVEQFLPVLLPGILAGVLSSLCGIMLPVMGARFLLWTVGCEGMTPEMNGMQRVVILLGVAVAGGLLYCVKQSCSRKLPGEELMDLAGKTYGAAQTLELGAELLTDLILVIYIGHFHIAAGMFALLVCLMVSFVIPWFLDRRSAKKQEEYAVEIGHMKDFIQDTLDGMEEIRQYDQLKVRRQEMKDRTKRLGFRQKSGNMSEEAGQAPAALLGSFVMVFLCMYLYRKGSMDYVDAVSAAVVLISFVTRFLY